MRALLPVLATALVAFAQDSARPRNNASFVPDEDEAVRALALRAEQLAGEGQWALSADRLQEMVLVESRAVVPVQGRELFVSPRRWAQIRLLSERPPFGREVLDAWRATHDAEAGRALAGAIATGDEEAVLRLVDRYPASTAAPVALLALFDRAVQRGDADAARGLLLRVPEHVARSEEEAWLASPAFARRQAHAAAMADPPPAGWPTLGGDSSRARNGDTVAGPEGLAKLWEGAFLEDVPQEFRMTLTIRDRDHSPLLPFSPVCDALHVYVHLGSTVAALDRRTGKLLFYAPDREPDLDEVDAMLAESPGIRAPTVADGVLYFERLLFDGLETARANELVAYDVDARRVLWTLQPEGEPLLPGKAFFFQGAPALAGGRLYAYAAVRDDGDTGPTSKEEAYLLCLDRATGAILWHRFLGYGDTDAPPRLPPRSGLPPAVRGGVVAVATGIGVAAALDARTGEVLWLFRHDRRPVRERDRLTEDDERKVHLRSGWLPEPPRILDGTLFLAPFDAEDLYCCWLRGRRSRSDGGFHLVQWPKGRTKHFYNSLLEYVAGVRGARIYYAGRRDENHAAEYYQTVVSNSLASEIDLAYARIPASGAGEPPEVFGRPVIAGDVLLVPTEGALFRFDVGGAPREDLREGERFREIPWLPPFQPPPPEVPEGAEVPPSFGNLVAVDGFLYAATADRVICYGPKTKPE